MSLFSVNNFQHDDWFMSTSNIVCGNFVDQQNVTSVLLAQVFLIALENG